MDSDQGPTMLRVDASTRSRSGWTLSGGLEVGIQSNRSFRVDQENPNPGTDIQTRLAEVVLANEHFGELHLGRGFAAAWKVPEIDLSGTAPAALLAVGNLAPGMRFVDAFSDELTSITVSEHFVDTERLLLVDRLRYDSRVFGGGFQLSGTLAADSRWDTALSYSPSPGAWALRAVVTYQHEPYRDIDDRVELGFSARHEATGLSFTTGGGTGTADDGRDPEGWVVKAGWLAAWNPLGTTAFSLDFASSKEVSLEGERSESWGLFGVQRWDAIDLGFYLGYREYEVERPDVELLPLRVSVFGVLYEF